MKNVWMKAESKTLHNTQQPESPSLQPQPGHVQLSPWPAWWLISNKKSWQATITKMTARISILIYKYSVTIFKSLVCNGSQVISLARWNGSERKKSGGPTLVFHQQSKQVRTHTYLHIYRSKKSQKTYSQPSETWCPKPKWSSTMQTIFRR